MNTAEKLAATYLRLNGFLLLQHFTVFSGTSHNHVDLVGFRPANSKEIVFRKRLPRDPQFSNLLSAILRRDSERNPIGVIGEARSNRDRDTISSEHVEYIRNFLGGVRPLRITFCVATTDFHRDDDGLRVSLRYAYEWIQGRIEWMEERGRLTKTGSWELSEEFLGDLLSLRRIIGHR